MDSNNMATKKLCDLIRCFLVDWNFLKMFRFDIFLIALHDLAFEHRKQS